VQLQVNHGPGLLRVYALFTGRALARSDVQQAVDRLARARRSITLQAKLPLSDVVQRSVLIDLK
jgi:hypothetical protein